MSGNGVVFKRMQSSELLKVMEKKLTGIQHKCTVRNLYILKRFEELVKTAQFF